MKTYGGFLVSRIRQVGGRVFDRMLKDRGMDAFNGPQGHILYVLWERGEMSISEIAKLTSLANTTLTGMLDRMEDMGLIERERDAVNRRRIIVRLTERAKTYHTQYDDISDASSQVFYEGFTDEEIAAFEHTLRRILGNLERYEMKNKN